MDIIICDDDRIQVKQIEQFLSSREGYTIFAFHSGAELLQYGPPACEIAILDVKLQDTLGTRLAETLRERYPEIDIIFISSYPQYVTSAFHVKASQFLIKPINRKTFLAEFDYILAERGSAISPRFIRCFRARYCMSRRITGICLSIRQSRKSRSAAS